MRRCLKNLRLIDGTGAPARAGAALVIEGDTLVHAGPLSAADEPRGSRSGAELMRIVDRIGTLQPGKLADFVVVDGDPLRDISVLQDRPRRSVMQGGRRFVTRNF
jgi:hypothetical protein